MKNLMAVGCLALVLVAGSSLPAQDYSFTTIAGNAGYGSSDGAGPAARFNQPTGLALDAAGNLLVADANNATIRKLTLTGTNWVVSTIAGRAGLAAADDGLNSAARFNNPFALVALPNGTVFVADANNSTIRGLSPSGADWSVSTSAGSAGNPGTDDGTNSVARLNGPLGVAADASGNLLVADTGNHTIRRITFSGTNGAVTTLAGQAETPGSDDGTNGAALFSAPIGLAVDAGGNAFISDSGNHTIRKLTFVGTNRVVTTIAGKAGFPGSDDGTNDVARFNNPTGVATDTAGNVYVAEWGSSRIRKLRPSGTNWVVTTIAGSFGGSADGTNDSAQFFQPYGLAAATNGSVYVADSSNNTIRKLTPVGTNWVVTTIAGLAGGGGGVDGTNFAARFANPHPGAVDSAGNVYIADSETYSIRKLTKVGTDWVATTIAGVFGASGSSDGTNSEARFFFPQGLTADTNGNVFVADSFNNTIRKLTRSGTNWVTTTIAGTPGFSGSGSADGTNELAQFSAPFALTADTSGNVFVADTFNNTIRKLTPVGTNWVVTTIAGLGGFGNSGSADGTNTAARFKGPLGIVAGAGGVLYVSDSDNSTIRRLAPLGTNWVTTTISGLATNAGSADGMNSEARFNTPAGLATDASGNLYVADTGNANVRKLTPEGTNWVASTLGGNAGVYGNADGIGTNAIFSGPASLAVDGAGNLFVGDNNSIRLGLPLAAAPPSPRLQIALLENQVVLSWPAWASNYALETTNTLPGGLSWVAVSGASLSGTNYVRTNPISSSRAFFRLHQQ